MVNAKLIIDRQEVNLLWFNFGFRQEADYNGRPSQKPVFTGLQLVIESRKDLDLTDWAIAPNQAKQIEVHIYPVILGGKTRKINFYDCHLVNWKNNFSSIGSEPMSETLEITAAGVKDPQTLTEYAANWRTTFPSEDVNLITREETEEVEDELALKFIAKFERLDTYKGEIGFDWMRDEYEEISENYEKLKKEYTPTKIHDQDYFVPWLSMFPNQENVKLNLVITEIEGSLKDTDIIKLPPKSGIKFVPNELKISEANCKEITVVCETPLSNDVVISLLDKDNNEVGKLNVFKNANHEQLYFNITPVRILRGVSSERDKQIIENMMDHSQGFGDKSKDINGDLQNLQKYLNEQSLNQALLQCHIGQVYDVIIDEEKWIADDLIVDEGCAFKGNLLDKFEVEFKKQHPKAFKNRGITVFLSPLKNVKKDNSTGAGGYGNLGDIDSKNLAIFETNLWNKESFAHEIAYVAGLEHSFREDEDLTAEEVISYNYRKAEIDGYFDKIIKTGGYTKEEIRKLWVPYSDEMRVINSALYTLNRNLYKFKQAETDNFMDYNNKRKSFWKFQWKSLQEDVLKFYNK
ncbi:hypothetical protein KO493_12535 [Tamlana agarivorans]|uniref:Uncharacterized protein n=1 Tax=Pseudotamlana agarivorans TaxID=481183 RepID=A0ACC5UB65_9FLAO|nr:type VI secretion system tube protein TssD [Tamlana agarivorans]MBU2951525.1 hypothetical protein [Tamlana agarivorans]